MVSCSGNAVRVSRAVVCRNVGPPAGTLVAAASRRRLVDIATLVAPLSVAHFRAEVQNSGLSSLLSYQTVRLCVFCGVSYGLSLSYSGTLDR